MQTNQMPTPNHKPKTNKQKTILKGWWKYYKRNIKIVRHRKKESNKKQQIEVFSDIWFMYGFRNL